MDSLAFLAVLTEKLNPRERAELLRLFDLSKAEADGLKKLGCGRQKAGSGAEVREA